MSRNLEHPTAYRFRHYDADRNLIWASGFGELFVPEGSKDHGLILETQEFMDNAVGDDGEQYILETAFRGGTAATNFYLRLYNDTPIETDTLSTLTGEVTGTGYAAQTIEPSAVGWPTSALDGGDWSCLRRR